MSIYGIGCDLVFIPRIDLKKESLWQKILSPQEWAEIQKISLERRKQEKIAGRFAAKEAILKAFKTGLAQGMEWHNLEIVSTETGSLEVKLSGFAADFCAQKGISQIHVNVSHDGDYAMAYAVAE